MALLVATCECSSTTAANTGIINGTYVQSNHFWTDRKPLQQKLFTLAKVQDATTYRTVVNLLEFEFFSGTYHQPLDILLLDVASNFEWSDQWAPSNVRSLGILYVNDVETLVSIKTSMVGNSMLLKITPVVKSWSKFDSVRTERAPSLGAYAFSADLVSNLF